MPLMFGPGAIATVLGMTFKNPAVVKRRENRLHRLGWRAGADRSG